MNDHSAHTPHEPSPGGGGSSDQQQPQDQKGHPKQYFLPGKILVHVEHSAGVMDIDFAALAHSIDTNVNETQGMERSLIKKVRPQNILTFPRREGPPFSVVPIEVDSKAPLVQTLLDLDKRLKTTGPVDLGQGATWQASSPNWLLGSASHGGSNPPSPGSWPLARMAQREQDRKFSLIAKDSEETRELPFAPERGANVHVAILDTVPCATDLDEAHELWHAENTLIDELLQPEPARKLRLVTDIYAEIELLEFSLARHRYWIADHGLFIAGEVASIAPEATIHLIKVFTSYGAASTLTLAQGLIRVLDDHEIGRPLIVNCSFGLAVPAPGSTDPDFPVDLRNSPADPHIEERMQTSLRALFEELTSQKDVIVVAAAGDDTDLDPKLNPSQQRAPTRFPAAYENVIAVGALPKDFPLENGRHKAASYSNLVNVPNPPDVTGYMTLGGEPGQGKGILGIYTSEIPSFPGESEGNPPKNPEEAKRDHLTYKHNLRGSAEWAGASFAAPIITGILANWCSEQIGAGGSITLDAARQALNDMSQTTRTDQDERVILVTQG